MTQFPARRHPEQMTLACRFLAPCGAKLYGQPISHVDKILVRFSGREFYVVLLGIAAPDPILRRPGHKPCVNPAAIRAVAKLYELIDIYGAKLTVELPPTPRPQSGCWEQGITNGSTHPGYIWLSDTLTLNEALLAHQVCTVPNRIDRHTLRQYVEAA